MARLGPVKNQSNTQNGPIIFFLLFSLFFTLLKEQLPGTEVDSLDDQVSLSLWLFLSSILSLLPISIYLSISSILN
jgi:hypothetical protein